MYKSLFLFFAISLTIISCGGPATEAKPIEIEGYEVTRISGTSIDRVIKHHETGAIEEQGYLLDGFKYGQWVKFNPKDGKIVNISNYSKGNLDGLYLKFSNREQIDLKANYKNNQMHGPYAEMTFGRLAKEANYADGVLEGLYKEYYNNGKLLKEIEFKNGKQDGVYRYYDEKGNVTIEYQYKDGEKVSGGMVN